MCTQSMPGVRRGQKRALGPLRLGLHVMRHYVCAIKKKPNLLEKQPVSFQFISERTIEVQPH